MIYYRNRKLDIDIFDYFIIWIIQSYWLIIVHNFILSLCSFIFQAVNFFIYLPPFVSQFPHCSALLSSHLNLHRSLPFQIFQLCSLWSPRVMANISYTFSTFWLKVCIIQTCLLPEDTNFPTMHLSNYHLWPLQYFVVFIIFFTSALLFLLRYNGHIILYNLGGEECAHWKLWY